LAEAVHMYNLALEASPDMASTQARIRNLARVHLPENRMSAAKELKAIPTTKLPMILDKSASADFDVLIAPSGRVESAAFVGGSELLRKAAKNLQEISYIETLPGDSRAYLLRRGVLSCDNTCRFVLYTPSLALSRFDQRTSAKDTSSAARN
jgi:hypothetical protein